MCSSDLKKIEELDTYSKACRELSAMSDRDLADIGIRRGDIEFIAREAVRQNKDKK